MFERQFGLRENPFAAGHQPRFVYPSREHQEALAHLRFGIENREPFVLITGEVGTGKTTALYDVLGEWQTRAVVALITNSALTRDELLEEICVRFGTGAAPGISKPQLLQQLERHLLAVRAQGLRAILILDEAQNLSRDLLEEIRLLSNLEAMGDKLLQIFLVGQPELEAILTQSELRQLRQRIAVHYRLHSLSEDDTERYIHHRLSVAGGHALTIFPSDACREVYRLTHGIPREINTVSAQAMLNAFVEDSPHVTPAHVVAVATETEFQSVARSAAAARGGAETGPPRLPDAPREHEAPPTQGTTTHTGPPPLAFRPPGLAPGAETPPTAYVPPALEPTTDAPQERPAWPRPPAGLRPVVEAGGSADRPGRSAEPAAQPAASAAAWEAWRSSFAENIERQHAPGDERSDAEPAEAERAPDEAYAGVAGEAYAEVADEAPTGAGTAEDAAFAERLAAAEARAFERLRAPEVMPVEDAAADDFEASPLGRAPLEEAEPAGAETAVAASVTDAAGHAERRDEPQARPSARRLEFEEAVEEPRGGGVLRWALVAAAVVVVVAGAWFLIRLGSPTGADREPSAAPVAATPAAPRETATSAPGEGAAPTEAAQPPASGGDEPAPASPTPGEGSAAGAAPAPSLAAETPPASESPSPPQASPPAAARPTPPASRAAPARTPDAPPAPARAAAAPAAPAAEAAGTWGIAVATYIFEDRATEERAKLATSTGLRASVSPVRENGDVSYRVVLGSYPSRAAAERAASDLIEKGLIDVARIVATSAPASR